MHILEDWLGVFLDRVAGLLGPVLVAFALGLISFCTFVFFDDVLPFYRRKYELGAFPELVMTFVGVFFLANTLFNYYKAGVVSPGLPPLASDFAESGGGENVRSALGNRLRQYANSEDEEEEWGAENGKKTPRPSVCGKCTRVRPARTHHCSVCKTCVLKMDHHCPWVYNCVGFGNYRFFYLFMLHLFLVDAFFLIVTLPVFRHALTLPLLGAGDSFIANDARSWVIMSFVLAAAVEIALLGFLSFHTYLLLTNQTTIEFVSGGPREDLRRLGKFRRNPFDVGRGQNWAQVFPSSQEWWTFAWTLSFLHKAGERELLPTFPTIGIKRSPA